MHEDLLGYLLGALEPEEMQRISEWLRDNPEGQEQLAKIERSLKPLEDAYEAVEGPSEDLLQRTLNAIPDGPPPSPDEVPSESLPTVTLTDVDLAGEAAPSGNRWRFLDSIGGLLSAAVLLALLLPMLAAGRGEARRVACEDQLRELGAVLMQYVFRDGNGRLPEVAETGPEAFAGVYAIHLADRGLLPEDDPRWCPSADLPLLVQEESYPGAEPPSRLISHKSLPTIEQLHQLPINELQPVQRYAGGHYAYTLGVIGEHGYSAPRFEGRASFAVMADAPLKRPISSGAGSELRFSHGGEGLNVLYEDGRVRFVPGDALDSMPDHPLFNHVGVNEAGVNIDDASLSPSHRGPFSISVQR